MNKVHVLSVIVRKTLALTSVAFVFAVAAVGWAQAPVASEEGGEGARASTEEVAPEPPENGMCCSYGAYACPSNGMDFSYAPPKCGDMIRSRARASCAAHCPVACTDSGWMDGC